ncbi:MAG: radical SAM protein [Ruminococcus sp.]|nr:radical SAM protein [Ruminococcus sp.]
MSICNICPRNCNVDRTSQMGFCSVGDSIRVSKAMLHHWEEPCISGENGSGAIFFSGCNLRCCYCQNYKISTQTFGKDITIEHLANIMISLQEQGANNINLVTPTHYTDKIIQTLDICKHKINIPIVYNCGGYEKLDTLKELRNYVDIYLTDFKYYSSEMSKMYSKCEDYFKVTSKAILEMYHQQNELVYKDNILQKGLIIRHLVLPTGRHDSISILEWLSNNLDVSKFLLSLMSQYTPNENCKNYPKIDRRTSTFEYNSVLDKAIELNFKGYMQDRRSAKSEYTPNFNLDGI